MFKINEFDSVREQIQDKLLDYFAEMGVETKSNGGIYFRCIHPDHPDKSPSANIIPNSHNREWKCHGCGAHGDIFTAAHYLEQKPIGSDPDFYQDTVLYLANRYDIPIDLGEMTEEEKLQFNARRAIQFASRYMMDQEPSELFYTALSEREWDPDRVRRMGIGQIPNYSEYKKAMLENEFDETFLENIDLLGNNAMWMFRPDRMVFTQFDYRGRPVGFVARNLQYEKEKEEGKETTKYRNTRSTGLYEKKRFLYNLDGAYEHPDRLVFVFEGQADVVSYRLRTGQSNCVALGGTAFTDDHVELLKELGIHNIALCLDGDDTGRKKTSEIVEHTGGNPGLSVNVITMPNDEDVDSFLRKYGKESWDEAKEQMISAFAWNFKNRDPEQPVEEFIRSQVQNIINEQEPIKRLGMIRELARAVDMHEEDVRNQVEFQSNKKDSERHARLRGLVNKTAEKLKDSPDDAEMIVARFQVQKESLDREYGTDVISEDFQLKMLQDLREHELDHSEDAYLKVGWPIFDEKTQGLPAEDTIFFVGGKANVGKTSLFANLAVSILQENEDAICICYTIDDSYAKFAPRMVAKLSGLPTHWVKRPYGMYKNLGNNVPPNLLPTGFRSREEVVRAGTEANKTLQDWVRAGRLKLIDAPLSGATWGYADRVVRQVRKDNPTSKIVLFLDNFHNLRDFPGGDFREKFSELADLIRNTTSRDRIMVFSTVEYTKLPDRVKPSNNNLAESRKMEYVADGIIHLVNHMHEFRNQLGDCKVFWPDANELETIIEEDGSTIQRGTRKPVVEMMFGKSKISSFKGSIYLEFDPERCTFKEGSDRDQIEWSQADGLQPWSRG